MKLFTRGFSLSMSILSLFLSLEQVQAQGIPVLNRPTRNLTAPPSAAENPVPEEPPTAEAPPAPTPGPTTAPTPPSTSVRPPTSPTLTPNSPPPAPNAANPKPSPSAPGAGLPALAATDDGIYLNAVDTDIREIIKLISKATGKNFLVDQKIRGKVTIVSEKKMTVEEAYQAFLSSLEVLGYTVVQAPGNLIKIIPMKGALQEPLPIYKSDSPTTDAFITRLIQLTNISALEMSNAIKDLVSKDGNLFAYPATNTLIVTDTGSNITRLLHIVRELDQEGPSEAIQMIALKYANAKDVAAKITQLYDQETGGSSAASRTAARPRARAGNVELSETPYISKVIPDERTNSVIVLASKRAFVKVKELIGRLDQKLELGAEGKIHVHYLKHADAKDLASVLSSLTSGLVPQQQAGGAPGAPPIPGSTRASRTAAAGAAGNLPLVAEFEGGVKIAADPNTNALIITATAKDYKTLADEVINKLDIPRKQVYVEVVIMELKVGKSRDVGVSAQGGAGISIGGNPALAFGSYLGGTSAGLASALSGALAAGVVSQTTQKIPITNQDGTITNLEIPTFGAVLTAFENDSNVNILSTPNLLTLDNEEAEIIVGQEQPFPSGTTLSPGGNETFNVNRENVGIKLKMTPQINEGDTVKIKLTQEVSRVIPTTEAILTSIGPTTTKRSVDTVVAAKDQQTIVIGGLIDDNTVSSVDKVPFLGDIPILGHLFKRKTTTKEKTNLLIFLRPYIIRDTKDFVKILQKKVEERNMFIDQNYGKRQREVVRSSIRTHSADLLEFRKDIQRQDWDIKNNNPKELVPVDSPPQTTEPVYRGSSTTPQEHRNQLIDATQDAGVK